MRGINKRALKKKVKATGFDELSKYLNLHMAALKQLIRIQPALSALSDRWSNPIMTDSGYSLVLSMSQLEGFKDKQLLNVLEGVLALDPTTMRSLEYPAGFNIDYIFEFGKVVVKVCAYARTDSPTCRKIVVGERFVPGYTEYQFKIECEGAAA